MIEQIVYYWSTGGNLMPALALVAFGIWFYFFRIRGALLGIISTPETFEEELTRNLNMRAIEENMILYKNRRDILSAAVVHVMAAAQEQRDPAAAFDEVQRERLFQIDRDSVLLAAFTVAAPLLGLLGTVMGMVATFRAVAGSFGNTAVEVSLGISQALITTQFGLVLAIPGLFGRLRIERLLGHAKVRLSECRTRLMRALEPAVERRAPS